jgi:S-adenosylmethionine/arginine decarboxylase-like enzyme
MRGFGIHMVIDIAGGTGYQTKDDGKNIEEFIDELCIKIDMEKHGPLIKDWFGVDNVCGWSIVQLITTSSITGHFCGEYDEFPETSNSAYLDVFSCKSFDTEVVRNVIKKYFNPDCISHRLLARTKPV